MIGISSHTAEDIIMIGKDLLDTKERLPHGSFLPWIEAEFGMHLRTAQRFMGVAETFKGKYDTVSHLDPTAGYSSPAFKTATRVIAAMSSAESFFRSAATARSSRRRNRCPGATPAT